MLPNTEWKVADLVTECAQKLSHPKTLEAVKKKKKKKSVVGGQ
jgi:hypothetical protein